MNSRVENPTRWTTAGLRSSVEVGRKPEETDNVVASVYHVESLLGEGHTTGLAESIREIWRTSQPISE
jgi:hypothetical protein